MEYGPDTYGEVHASVYDRHHAALAGVDDTVTFLRTLSGAGPALELGIGTGRVALPLAASGVEVHGVDASPSMLERMREKPGGDAIPVTIGDFGTFELESRFTLVYVVFNTFFQLLSQDEQVEGFRSVARHLADGGAFVLEAFVPDPSRFDRGQRVGVTAIDGDAVRLEVSVHDAATQSTESRHVTVDADGVHLYPVKVRYAYPAELDLMALLAGMRLRERWADWDRTPFTSSSGGHVSVYEQGAAR